MDVQFTTLVEFFVEKFIEQVRAQVIPRNDVIKQLDDQSPFYNVTIPIKDLYEILDRKALKFFYLCRARDTNHDYEFIEALVKINPGHEEWMQTQRGVCLEIESEQYLINAINFLKQDRGRSEAVLHYSQIVADE